MDSLGWAYYRIGNFEEAVKTLERAKSLQSEDPSIADHLGDSYWRVGRIQDAKAQWARALVLNPEPEEQPKIEAKIEKGLPNLLGIAHPDKAITAPAEVAESPPINKIIIPAGRRVALVIGNSNYQNASALPNPVNDATDISDSLKRLGFDVKLLTDAKFDDMRHGLISFGQQARGAELAVVFFAGHGMQIGGENWLIPIDAQLSTELDVANETIGLQSLTRAVSSATKLGLVILDACRNNPFLPKIQGTSLTRSVERGLARIEPNDNVLVAYSSREGTTANDGSGRNSPFTSSLLKYIETPGLEVRFLFAGVRDDVMAATKRAQQPFIYGSLSSDYIYLKSP